MTEAHRDSTTLSRGLQALDPNEANANRSVGVALTFKNSKYFLNAAEAADVLRMDSRTLVRWARLGQIPAHPLGDGKRKLWRFIETELISWLAERGTSLKKPVTNTMDTAISAHARRTA